MGMAGTDSWQGKIVAEGNRDRCRALLKVSKIYWTAPGTRPGDAPMGQARVRFCRLVARDY